MCMKLCDMAISNRLLQHFKTDDILFGTVYCFIVAINVTWAKLFYCACVGVLSFKIIFRYMCTDLRGMI